MDRSIAGACIILLAAVTAQAQIPAVEQTRTGQVQVEGVTHAYSVHSLPVSSFPQLPAWVAEALLQRGCRIPQTWEAHGPENVVKASLERAGSEDWAVLCAAEGKVTLLVFLASSRQPVVLAESTETARLEPIGAGVRYGFGWGIDPATPEQVHQRQAGLTPRPARIEHDALAESLLERKTIYHFFNHGVWTVLTTAN
jgi:hypothetical protein